MRVRRLCQVAGAALVLALGVSGCSSDDSADTPAETAAAFAEPTVEPTEEPTAEPTEDPTADPAPEPTPTEDPTPEPTEEPAVITGAEEQFLGLWLWEGDTVTELRFNEDGTGTSFWGDFTWAVVGDEIQWQMGPTMNNELWRWAFTFDGNDLNISSRQVPGMEYTYFRSAAGNNGAEPAGDSPASHDSAEVSEEDLIGLWLWNMDSSVDLVFHADGTGNGYMGPFGWELLPGNELQWNLHQLGEVARWEVSIDGDSLDIVSLQVAGIEWTYLRATSN